MCNASPDLLTFPSLAPRNAFFFVLATETSAPMVLPKDFVLSRLDRLTKNRLREDTKGLPKKALCKSFYLDRGFSVTF